MHNSMSYVYNPYAYAKGYNLLNSTPSAYPPAPPFYLNYSDFPSNPYLPEHFHSSPVVNSSPPPHPPPAAAAASASALFNSTSSLSYSPDNAALLSQGLFCTPNDSGPSYIKEELSPPHPLSSSPSSEMDGKCHPMLLLQASNDNADHTEHHYTAMSSSSQSFGDKVGDKRKRNREAAKRCREKKSQKMVQLQRELMETRQEMADLSLKYTHLVHQIQTMGLLNKFPQFSMPQ